MPILRFNALASGKEWEAREGRKYLLLEGEGSGYNLYIAPIEEEGSKEGEGKKEVKEVKEGYNTIKVLLPSLFALYEIVDMLYSMTPRFSTLKEVVDDCC
tara:strand:+ start:1724 stop:2023 length:300 start_codon:yes stop_codon:yes gene_type:complete